MDAKVSANKFAGEKLVAIPISITSWIFEFFALYKPSKFETDIVNYYKSLLTPELKQNVDAQVAAFNRMRRFINYEVSFVVFAHSNSKLFNSIPKLNDYDGLKNVASI